MDEIDVILAYKRITGRESYRRPRINNKGDLAVAAKFLAWCKEHMVEPTAVIHVRCERTGRCGKVPAFNTLRSERALLDARKLEATRSAMEGHVERKVQAVRDLSVLSPGHEQVRERYFREGRQDLCQINSMAGGYDPRSQYCHACPHYAECSATLNAEQGFDVVALRFGAIRSLPKLVQNAMEGWHGSVPV